MSCPFCHYAGPSEILADYGDVFVIEPINPVTQGHVLVIPRRHMRDATFDRKLTGRVFEVAALEAEWRVAGACNIITSIGEEATQTVMHFHVHVVPRREGDGLALPWSQKEEAGA